MRPISALLMTVGLFGIVFATDGGSMSRRPTKTSDLVARGKRLFESYSCGGCHTLNGREGAGPTLKHLYGSRVKLANGKTVIATETYLLRSILEPNAQIVAGRQKDVMTMVIRRGTVPRRDALALVALIKSLK
jgi:cytochrome c oxidase subunit II